MIQREITWTNFADEEVSKTYYFHITKAEAVEEFLGFAKGSNVNDFETILKEIIASRDNKKIIGHFKTLLIASVGLRSADGRQFIKDEEITKEFKYSGAMDELLMWMFQNADGAAEFILGMFPKEFVQVGEEKGVIKDGKIVDVNLIVSATPVPEKMPYEMVDLGKIPDPPKPIDDRPVEVIDDRKDELKKYTRGELMAMSDDDFFATVGTNHKKWSRDVMEMAFIRRTSASK